MASGKVKWWNNKKGFGFIINEQGQDVFVHYSSIVGGGFKVLHPGEELAFDLVQSDKGLRAANVQRPAGSAPSPGPSEMPGSRTA